jgi:hypothetical protein
MSEPVSPLTEANSASLDEYFARKPPYDAATLARIKQEFRRMREIWQKSAQEGGKGTRAKKVSVPLSKEIEVDLFAAEDLPKGENAL